MIFLESYFSTKDSFSRGARQQRHFKQQFLDAGPRAEVSKHAMAEAVAWINSWDAPFR